MGEIYLIPIFPFSLVGFPSHPSLLSELRRKPKGVNAGLHRIGDIKLTQITAHDVEALFKSMLDGGLGSRTINKVRSIMANSFNSAIRKGILKHNTFDVVDSPKPESKEKAYLTYEELSRLLGA